jgi:hypothetical protein
MSRNPLLKIANILVMSGLNTIVWTSYAGTLNS